MLFEMVVSTDRRSVWQCCPLVNSVKLTQVLIDACCANLSFINPELLDGSPRNHVLDGRRSSFEGRHRSRSTSIPIGRPLHDAVG